MPSGSAAVPASDVTAPVGAVSILIRTMLVAAIASEFTILIVGETPLVPAREEVMVLTESDCVADAGAMAAFENFQPLLAKL